MGPGKRCTPPCEKRSDLEPVETERPAQRSSTAQSARTTEKGGLRGYDGAKKINGRKRHLLVDTGGLVMNAKVHPADLADRDGARMLLDGARDSYPSLRHLWADADTEVRR
jgi:putative transposase